MKFYSQAGLAALLQISSLITAGSAAPINDENEITSQLVERNSKNLRILPLGASITYGTGSSDGNGYREDLLGKLVQNGYKVDYVGTQHHGSMSDNAMEGYPGARIGQVQGKADKALAMKPNVVLIHVGTNDMSQGFELSGAPDRLGGLIDDVISKNPKALVIASQLIPNKKATTESRIKNFNSALPAVIAKRKNAGHNVVLVNMHTIPVSEIGSDGTHPTDEGYKQMAHLWYEAISKATSSISPPA